MRTPEYQRPITVYLACTRAWIPEADVVAQNIEEDIQGRDILTFQCPHCGESHRSLRRG